MIQREFKNLTLIYDCDLSKIAATAGYRPREKSWQDQVTLFLATVFLFLGVPHNGLDEAQCRYKRQSTLHRSSKSMELNANQV